MLRLTTKVTRSPASSARSSSAADAHLLDHLGARLGEQRGQLLLASAPRPGAPFSIARGATSGVDRPVAAPARALARDEAPVLELDHVEHALLHPLRDRGTAGRRRGARSARSPAAARRLRTWCGLGKACSGEMWSPLADRPPRSVAPSSTSSSHQSERFGGIWMPTSGISRRHSRTSSFMSSSVIGVAQSRAARPCLAGSSVGPPPVGRLRVRSRSAQRSRALVGDLGHLAPVVAAGAGRSSGGSPPGCGRGAR